MYRVSNGTQAASLPTPAAVSGTPGFFTPGIPGTTPATIVDQDWANMVQEELYALVVAGGMTPDKTNNAQVLASLRALFAAASTVSTKSAAYTITTSDNGALIVAGAYAMTLPSAPATAFRVTILSSATGTTILPNGNTVNLASGATSSTISLPAAGDFVTLAWDGSVWRVVGGSQLMLGLRSQFPSTLTGPTSWVKKIPDPNSPSGYFIIQGGRATISTGNGDTVTFPVAFPNAVLGGWATDYGNGCSQMAFVLNGSNLGNFLAYSKTSGTSSYASSAYGYIAVGY